MRTGRVLEVGTCAEEITGSLRLTCLYGLPQRLATCHHTPFELGKSRQPSHPTSMVNCHTTRTVSHVRTRTGLEEGTDDGIVAEMGRLD